MKTGVAELAKLINDFRDVKKKTVFTEQPDGGRTFHPLAIQQTKVVILVISYFFLMEISEFTTLYETACFLISSLPGRQGV